MSRRKKIYEGKAKIIFEGPEPGTLVQYFKDDATAFNAKKKAVLNGKGALNNSISEFLMLKLAGIGIPTHFIKRLNMREQLIKKVEIIPLEVICRNTAAGSICTLLGLEEGTPLPRTLVEFCYKKDELNDPLVCEEHIVAFGWATPAEISELVALTLRVNDYLCGLFAGAGIKLIDFKLEYGRHIDDEGNQKIILADEISPDSCRLWDAETNKKLDKDRFRRDLGEVTENYREVATRLGIIKTNGNGGANLSVVPIKES
jgi:phosphoribosylaminoimidazole-succinocarboxamide synthase